MPDLRTWFVVVAVAIILLAVAGFALLSSAPTLTVSEKDDRMRPAIGESATDFAIDTSWLDTPKRNAIVAFMPKGTKTPLAGRAVAVAGDRVSIENWKCHVNGTATESRRRMSVSAAPPTKVPRGCVYILFDKGTGPDSAQVGPIPLWRVLGSVN